MMKRTWVLLSTLILVGLLAATTASADMPVRKIVVFRENTAPAAKQTAVRDVGGKQLKSLRMANAVAAELTSASAAALAVRPDVLRVIDDGIAQEHTIDAPDAPKLADRQAEQKPNNGSETVPWGISRIHAPEAWEYAGGTGVKVAVLDSGIDLSHPDLRVAGGVNEVDGARGYDDDRGHGTHVAGVIAALSNKQGVVGVGPAIELYAVKVLDKKGRGWWSDIFAGLDWCVDNGIQVANLSFGSAQYDQTYEEVIYRTHKAGVVLVASAGNNGPTPDSVHYPARYPGVIAVAAIDSSDRLPSWSSTGPQVDLAAPGVDILSTYTGPHYTTLSGTSMAAPHVTGAAALSLAVDPKRSPNQVEDLLKATATTLAGLSTDQQGAGLVDALKAVNGR